MKLYKFNRRLFALFILFSVINPCYSIPQAPWKLRHNGEGIELYTREVINSDYLQVKVHAIFPVSYGNLLAQFGNDDKCWKWVENCLSVKLLKQVSVDEKIIYSVLAMPWPLTKRDFVFRLVKRLDTQKSLATLSLSPASGIYKTTEHIRAKSTITYRLESLSANSSSLSILMHTEFGGTMPAILINSNLVSYYLNEIKELTKLLEKNDFTSTHNRKDT